MNGNVNQRIVKAEAQIERLVSDAESEKETRKRRNEKFDLELKKLNEAIHGNGKEGLKIRIDRLEQWKKVVMWMGGIIMGMLAKDIIEIIKQL